MNKPATLGLVERVKSLAPLIAQEADEIERTRRLTAPVVSALLENGLYRSLLPQSVGGHEAQPQVFMQMLEEVAKVDASTAWCLGQCSVCGMTAAYLDLDVAREIYSDPHTIISWGPPNKHRAKAVPGGQRRHVDRILGGLPVCGPGLPRRAVGVSRDAAVEFGYHERQTGLGDGVETPCPLAGVGRDELEGGHAGGDVMRVDVGDRVEIIRGGGAGGHGAPTV